TIDDELSHGTFTAEYRLENMGPLSALLRAAVDAGRVVIVTADHGHVLGVGLDGKGQAAISGDGGARWRVADREPTQDEVLLRGPRVLLGDERGILAPWHDDLRYSAKSGGYHGGATPDECLVPLAVFAPTGVNPPDGWELVAVPQPAWWDLQVEVVEAETQRSTPKRRKAAKAPDPGQQLFPVETAPTEDPTLAAGGQAAPAGAVAPWADRLLASEIYAVQLGALSRAKPKEENVRATLGALYGRGGLVNFGVVAQVTGLAPSRVPGFLAMLSRLLNVDGFGVLAVDSAAQEARLDEQLLLDQFLDGGAA
ncbi:MAG: BREX-2 system phosphatase PglZ, partial [Actinomycetes bacterium]